MRGKLDVTSLFPENCNPSITVPIIEPLIWWSVSTRGLFSSSGSHFSFLVLSLTSQYQTPIIPMLHVMEPNTNEKKK
jgi:hypothetical protein